MGSIRKSWKTRKNGKKYTANALRPFAVGKRRARPQPCQPCRKGIIAKGRVLDICSGLGTQTIYLAKKGFEVYEIDPSPTAVKMAKKKCGVEGVTYKLLTADATNT